VRALAAQILVIAKAPVPGRVKTRLTPPFSPVQAAQLAGAALADTLAAAARVPAARHVLALDGEPGDWLPAGFDVIGQRGSGLAERIAAALGEVYGGLRLPAVLIGMDTPQVTPALLEAAIRPLLGGEGAPRAGSPAADADATLGMAGDGGFWLLGLRRPDPRLVTGVPMSTPFTGAAQLARLAGAGLRVRQLPCCTDVDTAADAVAVARQIPDSRFAAALRAIAAEPKASGELTAARVLRHCYLVTRCEPIGAFSWLARNRGRSERRRVAGRSGRARDSCHGAGGRHREAAGRPATAPACEHPPA
jgi:glycosyltransferase A (GT-A) superfamily protein (DUF2064 family)